MMKFEVVPNKSIGKVSFGMKRDDIRGILKGFKQEFKKSIFSKTTTDDFGYCHVYYNKKNECEAVEFSPSVSLMYKNKNLFKLSREDLIKLFDDIIEEYGSFISKEYSIGISFDGDEIESILIGCEGYYC